MLAPCRFRAPRLVSGHTTTSGPGGARPPQTARRTVHEARNRLVRHWAARVGAHTADALLTTNVGRAMAKGGQPVMAVGARDALLASAVDIGTATVLLYLVPQVRDPWL